jgi:hypothetical protein
MNPCISPSRLAWLRVLAALIVGPAWGAEHPLQAVLDRGEDVWLEPGSVHEIRATLRYRRPGQKIGTRGASSPDQFATLRLAPGALICAVDATGVARATLERLILDGNRRALLCPSGKVPAEPMTSWGKPGGDGQVIRECLIFDARCGGGWAAIHIHEGAQGILVENNVIMGAGTDARGNGRAETERAFGWGDGISTASRETQVRNNLIVDATDDGIMVQGAPGSLIEGNLIAAVSREMLGGIAVIDPYRFYAMAGTDNRFDYRGVVVRGNRIEAWGSWIHIGIPLGGAGWNQRMQGTWLVGATVVENTLSGGAFGYGMVANGIDGFTVKGNRSTATHSGRGDGPRDRPPDPAGPFLYNPAAVVNSILQPEFRPQVTHLVSLLRCWPPPADPRGYRIAPYTDAEAAAVVRAASAEMLGRETGAEELRRWIGWLREPGGTADRLRVEFLRQREGGEATAEPELTRLQSWRIERWRRAILTAWREAPTPAGGRWPATAELYAAVRRRLEEPMP